MKKLYFISFILLILGCYRNTMQQEANRAAINHQILTAKKLNFLTLDTSEYRITVQYMDEKILRGKGEKKQNNDTGWQDFAGEVMIDSIDFLRFSEKDVGKSLFLNSAMLTVLIKGMMAGEGPAQPTIEFVYPPGSSCPFIYSLQGENYVLEGEAFGIALGKAREMTTATVLSLSHSYPSDINIRITNERPESHFINQVSLEAFAVDEEAFIRADNEQSIWPVYQTNPPVEATGPQKTNVWQEISAKDNCYWQSGIFQDSGVDGFRDEIQLIFERPAGANEGSLLIDAINTYFGNYVFEEIFSFLGDQSLEFMQQIENDRESIHLMENWARESALKAYVWDKGKWIYCGMIFPEANVVPFSRLIRFKVPPGDENRIRIKLKSLADVWKIDAVQVDWTAVKKINGQKIPLISADGPFVADLSGRIEAFDNQYTVLLPSQKIDLDFNSPAPVENKKYLYVLRVGGYLYEWLPCGTADSQFADMNSFTGMNKVNWVKALLRQRELLLPLLYSGWKERANQYN